MDPSSPGYPPNYPKGQAPATLSDSQFYSPGVPQNFSTGPGRSHLQKNGSNTLSKEANPYDLANAGPVALRMLERLRVKRKRAASSRILKKDERKKVSRACDACEE
jgi:hypothetical protein